MEKIKIGRIVNAVALRGEVKVYNYSDYKERYEELSEIYIEDNLAEIEKVRYQNHMVILKIKGVDDRNAAEKLKEKDIYITEDDLRELPEDTYYIRDILGSQVFLENGEKLGLLTDVIQNRGQDLYEIEKEDKNKVLIPAVSEFVLEVNTQEKFIKVRVIEGLLEL